MMAMMKYKHKKQKNLIVVSNNSDENFFIFIQ